MFKYPWSFFVVPEEGEEFKDKFSSWASLMTDGEDGKPLVMMTTSHIAETPQAALAITIEGVLEIEGRLVFMNPRVIKFKWVEPQ